MYIITSLTSSDIAFETVSHGDHSVTHLTEKFSVAESSELTDDIIRLDISGQIKYAEVDTPEPEVPQKRRGRRGNNNQEESSTESTTDESSTEENNEEGGNEDGTN